MASDRHTVQYINIFKKFVKALKLSLSAIYHRLHPLVRRKILGYLSYT